MELRQSGDPRGTTLVEDGTIHNMPSRSRTPSRKPQAKPIRQSVTIPAPLAAEVRRVAKQRHLTISRALVSLAERGAGRGGRQAESERDL